MNEAIGTDVRKSKYASNRKAYCCSQLLLLIKGFVSKLSSFSAKAKSRFVEKHFESQTKASNLN